MTNPAENELVQREADDSTGALVFSLLCWDGKRRVVAKVHPVSKRNPDGGISYLERHITTAAMRVAEQHALPGAPRWPCDYL